MYRFIPACAGNTAKDQGMSSRYPVHPRVRGEHTPCNGFVDSVCGSSPRARGTRIVDGFPLAFVRFIPACAGNTLFVQLHGNSPSVHPRVRGEHTRRLVQWSNSTGSSPRARGTHRPVNDRRLAGRFIPACAGNTRSRAAFAILFAVHPRVRGEHAVMSTLTTAFFGSSPRARGTRLIETVQFQAFRFIPACAGNTWWTHPCLRRPSVHPRVRGEHATGGVSAVPRRGSSPRARGTRVQVRGERGEIRFIPACAGNTY